MPQITQIDTYETFPICVNLCNLSQKNKFTDNNFFRQQLIENLPPFMPQKPPLTGILFPNEDCCHSFVRSKTSNYEKIRTFSGVWLSFRNFCPTTASFRHH